MDLRRTFWSCGPCPICDVHHLVQVTMMRESACYTNRAVACACSTHPFFCWPGTNALQKALRFWPWCRALLRHGVILMTRAEAAASMDEYRTRLCLAQTCLHAYGCVAEFYFQDCADDFAFSYKLHQAVAHMAPLAISNGHPSSDNDLWVERMVRCDAVRAIVCAFQHGMHGNNAGLRVS